MIDRGVRRVSAANRSIHFEGYAADAGQACRDPARHEGSRDSYRLLQGGMRRQNRADAGPGFEIGHRLRLQGRQHMLRYHVFRSCMRSESFAAYLIACIHGETSCIDEFICT